jgi:hypothetical protein
VPVENPYVGVRVGAKRLVIPRERLAEELPALGERYACVSVFFPGSPEHAEAGLREDVVLVRAWRKRG